MDTAFDSPVKVLVVMALVLLGGYVAIKVLKGVLWATGRVFQGIGRLVRHAFEFVANMVRDVLRLGGSILAAVAYLPALLLSVLFVRRSAALHYVRALRGEAARAATSLYRLALGNLLRLLGLEALTEGLEQRVPEVIARAPGRDRPSSGPASFPGYRVTGSLAGGGSGARLWLAEPDADKLRQLARTAPRGAVLPATVVIKSFSLADGSTLPQIVRENRALAAARELGLVLEHELSASRFHYVMPYVPGEDLSAETARLHAASGGAGLDDAALRRALSLTDDLLSTLQRFHKGGLWHKDVKPGNVIVSDGRAHLVDFGLITPLASAMTLTTHGTEYFRDPEMVRLALRGVKVHEVDGIKFDVYGAGAVLFSLIEGSFPAHGSLSRLTRRCPEALRWIIRRAMADVAHRYASAAAMLEDLRTVSGAADPFAVRPADLPSLAGRPRIAEALALPIAGEDEEPALGAEAVPSGSPGEVRHGQAEQPAEQRFAGGARGDGDERRHERAAADAPPVSGDLRVPRDRGGMPAGERRWRPLDPPYGRRGWSRKGFAAAAILVLAFSHFRDAGASGSRRTPRAPRGSDVPVVSSAGGARAGAENGAGSYRGGPESGQDGSARPAAMRGDASSDGDGETSAVEAAHAVLRAEGIEMLEPVSVETLQARAELQPPLPPPPAGLVLVLDDLPAGAKPERVAAVEALRDRLRAARYALLGGTDAGASGPPGTSAPTGTSEVELLAGAGAAVGLADPSDMEAVGRLSTFLATQGDGLDAILWIGRADDDAPVQTRVIARDEDAARVLGRLLDGRRDG